MGLLRTVGATPVLIALCLGCAARLPRYPDLDADRSLRVLSERSARIDTVTARGRIVLTNRSGRSVQLEGALAARPPDHLRIRAWKASQPVLDLTLRSDGLWLFRVGRDDGDVASALNGLTGDRVRPAWLLWVGAFDRDLWSVSRIDHRTLVLAHREGDGASRLACEVDRRTLTPRRCELRDADDSAAMTIRWDGYRHCNGVVWPSRIMLEALSGSITVLMDEVVLNDQLPPRAFEPPTRAVRQP